MVVKGITPYSFTGIKAYHQYSENDTVVKFFNLVNEYILGFLQSFYREFATNLNLALYNSGSKTYAEFYLANYFGLTKIPTPSNLENLTKYLYDSGYMNYDSNYPSNNIPYSYDALLNDSTTEKGEGYLNPRLWTAIAKYILDYSKPVHNIPGVISLIDIYHRSEANRPLDITKVKINFANGDINFILPDEEIFRNFIYIQRFAGDRLGLPFSATVIFKTESDIDAPN